MYIYMCIYMSCNLRLADRSMFFLFVVLNLFSPDHQDFIGADKPTVSKLHTTCLRKQHFK